jgi:hypothetical protein
MQHVLLTPERLAVAKGKLKKNLSIKSGHLSEAIARSLGASSHAAILADLRQSICVQKRVLTAADFLSRLVELGYSTNSTHAELALMHALLPYTATDSELDDPHSIEVTANRIDVAKKGLRRAFPWTQDILSYEDAPDPTVKTIRIDRDIWRWNPAFLRSFDHKELDFVIANAAVHRTLGHGARRAHRDAATWDIVCELIVNDALISWKIGEPFTAINWDGRYDRSLSAEEAFGIFADANLASKEPGVRHSWFEQGAWPSPRKSWPTRPSDIHSFMGSRGMWFDGVIKSLQISSRDQSTPTAVSAIVLEAKTSLRDLMHLSENGGGLPSSAPVTFTKTLIEANVGVAVEDIPALISKHPWLMTMSLRGQSIRESIETALREMAVLKLADAVGDIINEAWSESTSIVNSTVNDALRWLSGTYLDLPKQISGFTPPPESQPPEKAAEWLLRRANHAQAMIEMSRRDREPEYKKSARFHSAKLLEVRIALEAIQEWYRAIERLLNEPIH